MSILQRKVAISIVLVVLALHSIVVRAADPIRFYGATDNRARVAQSSYAYYPQAAELRVRLTLVNRQVKSGRYRDPVVVGHLLTLLSNSRPGELFCVYDGNDILTIYAEQLPSR